MSHGLVGTAARTPAERAHHGDVLDVVLARSVRLRGLLGLDPPATGPSGGAP